VQLLGNLQSLAFTCNIIKNHNPPKNVVRKKDNEFFYFQKSFLVLYKCNTKTKNVLQGSLYIINEPDYGDHNIVTQIIP
jgi:hypothetical protein